jgi:hypothetical protein
MMGDTASPGSDVNAAIDHIPIIAAKEISPFPVFIFIKFLFFSINNSAA